MQRKICFLFMKTFILNLHDNIQIIDDLVWLVEQVVDGVSFLQTKRGVHSRASCQKKRQMWIRERLGDQIEKIKNITLEVIKKILLD